MKIKQEHYNYLKSEIESMLKSQGLSIDELKKEYDNNGLTDMRFRWDLTYAAKLSKWICDNLYSYLNDAHIDTALRNIVNDIS